MFKVFTDSFNTLSRLRTLGDEERCEKEDMRGRAEVMFGLQEASLNLKLTLKLTCLSFRVL